MPRCRKINPENMLVRSRSSLPRCGIWHEVTPPIRGSQQATGIVGAACCTERVCAILPRSGQYQEPKTGSSVHTYTICTAIFADIQAACIQNIRANSNVLFIDRALSGEVLCWRIVGKRKNANKATEVQDVLAGQLPCLCWRSFVCGSTIRPERGRQLVSVRDREKY